MYSENDTSITNMPNPGGTPTPTRDSLKRKNNDDFTFSVPQGRPTARQTLTWIKEFEPIEAIKLRKQAEEFSTQLVTYINQHALANMWLEPIVSKGCPAFRFGMLEDDFDFEHDINDWGRHFDVSCFQEEKAKDDKKNRNIVVFGKRFLSRSVDEHMSALIEDFRDNYTYEADEDNVDDVTSCRF